MPSSAKPRGSLGESYKRLSDVVYHRLRHEMMWGAMEPGRVLSVRRIAEDFGVSPMPVRDALHRLSLEGMVEVSPRSSSRVADVSAESVRQIYEVRSCLEPLAARLALKHLTPADTRFLKRCIAMQEAAASKNRPLDWHRWNREFHFLIFRRCANGLLERTSQEICERNFRHFSARAMTLPGFCARRQDEHKRILEAIERGDADGLETAWRDHLVQSGRETLEYLRGLHPDTRTTHGPDRQGGARK